MPSKKKTKKRNANNVQIQPLSHDAIDGMKLDQLKERIRILNQFRDKRASKLKTGGRVNELRGTIKWYEAAFLSGGATASDVATTSSSTKAKKALFVPAAIPSQQSKLQSKLGAKRGNISLLKNHNIDVESATYSKGIRLGSNKPMLSLHDVDDLDDLLEQCENYCWSKLDQPVSLSADILNLLKINGITSCSDFVSLFEMGQESLLCVEKVMNIKDVNYIKIFLNNNGYLDDHCSNESNDELQICNKKKPEIDLDDGRRGIDIEVADKDKVKPAVMVDTNQIDLDKVDEYVLTEIKFNQLKGKGRMILGLNCAAALIKELIVIYFIWKRLGATKLKGAGVYEKYLDGSKSTLRRKKPAFRCIVWCGSKYQELEDEHVDEDGYMKGKHLEMVKEAIEDRIDAEEMPTNPSLALKYYELFGVKEDRVIVKRIKAELRNKDTEATEKKEEKPL